MVESRLEPFQGVPAPIENDRFSKLSSETSTEEGTSCDFRTVHVPFHKLVAFRVQTLFLPGASTCSLVAARFLFPLLYYASFLFYSLECSSRSPHSSYSSPGALDKTVLAFSIICSTYSTISCFCFRVSTCRNCYSNYSPKRVSSLSCWS